MVFGLARPPTRLEYRLKTSITFDPTVGSCAMFYKSFRRLFSLASNEVATRHTQGLVGPDHRPDKSTGSKGP
jgi:hypothetical protein